METTEARPDIIQRALKSIQADGEAERRTPCVFFLPPCTFIKREKRQLNQSDS